MGKSLDEEAGPLLVGPSNARLDSSSEYGSAEVDRSTAQVLSGTSATTNTSRGGKVKSACNRR
jgi:hypothetical protein